MPERALGELHKQLIAQRMRPRVVTNKAGRRELVVLYRHSLTAHRTADEIDRKRGLNPVGYLSGEDWRIYFEAPAKK